MTTDKITCCKDCATRHPGCHGTCEKHIQQKAEHEAWKEEQRKKHDIKKGLNEYKYDSMRKIVHTRIYRSKYRRSR